MRDFKYVWVLVCSPRFSGMFVPIALLVFPVGEEKPGPWTRCLRTRSQRTITLLKGRSMADPP